MLLVGLQKAARSELRLSAQVAVVYQGIVGCCLLHTGTASPDMAESPGPDFSPHLPEIETLCLK